MCQIAQPMVGPKEGQTFSVTVSGNPPLEWIFDISGHPSAHKFGSSNTSPATASIAVPTGTAGDQLVLNLKCTMGADGASWLIS